MKNRIGAMRSEKGFTMAEVLIVVAIIGVLIAIAIPSFAAQLASSRQSADDASCRMARAIATVECKANDDGKFSAKTPEEWVTFVTTGKNSVSSTSQVDSSSLTCSYTESDITFVYGGTNSGTGGGTGGGGTGGTAAGSVTVTDSTGASHTVSVSGDWEALKASVDGGGGVVIPEGVVYTDSTGTYVGGYSQYVHVSSDTTLAQAMAINSSSLFKITAQTKCWCAADVTNGQWQSAPARGDLCYWNGALYIAPNVEGQWTFPPGGWIAVG